MGVSELFYQSALINALLFLWVASVAGAMRVFLRCDKKISGSFAFGLMLGPIAFVTALFYERFFAKTSRPKTHYTLSSCGAILSSSILMIACFHVLFVSRLNEGHEAILVRLALYFVIAGLILGFWSALITRRVGFFETCWTTCFFSLYILSLREWAYDVFAYGTSMAYFSTLILCACFLFSIFQALGGALGYLFLGEGRFNARYGYEFFIGMRFLMTKRSSQVVSLITVISVMAVMIACGGMIIVMSVMNGFTHDLRSKILGANPHLMVLKYGKDFYEYGPIVDKTKAIPSVISVTPFIINEGMIAKNKNLSSALITGIDFILDKNSQIFRYVTEESLKYLYNPETIPVIEDKATLDEHDPADKAAHNELPGVIIGKEMAKDLQVFVGETITLVSPTGDIGPTGPIPKAKAFRIAGFFDSGMYEYDAKFAYIRLRDAQEFFNLKDQVTGIEYRLDDVEKTRQVAETISDMIGGYPFYTRDWMQMNRNMFSALQLEKIAMLIILGTLIFMASLLILVTLIMVVMEKGKEIAILKSMGATDASIMKIFVSYGLFVGGLGAVLGGGLGMAVCMLIDKIGIQLDSDVYYFSKVPVRIESMEIFLVVISAVIISFLATVPPSLFAARLKPVEGLRYE